MLSGAPLLEGVAVELGGGEADREEFWESIPGWTGLIGLSTPANRREWVRL